MKKIACVIILVVAFSTTNLYALEAIIEGYVNELVSLLGNSVPDGFVQTNNPTAFLRESDNTVLWTQNNLVVYSTVGGAFATPELAIRFASYWITFLRNSHWEYHRTFSSGYRVYLKNGIFAGISSPISGVFDHLYGTLIGFSRNTFPFDF